MGIAFSAIRKMEELGLFAPSGARILDIGSSNLYSATAEEVKHFLSSYGKAPMLDADEFAARLAAGSGYDAVTGGRNEAFVGELFQKAGMEYASFDIADGYQTTILDLNHAVLPAGLRGKFNLVLNFGTTEHILNQLNCFKIIHDATKPGGYIYHSLPAVGYVNHGYVTYTGRCFFDVAGFNEYEIVACWFDGPAGGAGIFDSLESYSVYFPALGKALKAAANNEQVRALRDLRVPDVGINVVYRKVKDRPFLGALESSTSVGAIPSEVASAYDGVWARTASPVRGKATARAVQSPSLIRIKQCAALALRRYPPLFRAARRAFRAMTAAGRQAEENPLTQEELVLRDRLLGATATCDEGLRLYSSMTARGLGFPLPWEEAVITTCLTAEPGRADLRARLRHVLTAQGKAVPADLEVAFAQHATAEERGRDHQRDAAEYHAKTGTADMDPQFLPIYERCRTYSMTSVERMYALFSAVKYVEQAGIEGDIVECGVWRGGSMMIVAETLLALGSKGRNLYLFDTYTGLPRPDEKKDVDIWGNRALDGWLPRRIGEEASHWAEATIEEVQANLSSTGYPVERLHFVKGMVERTIPESAPRRIALLRLDTDWYASTKHELDHLFRRLSVHGVLVLDDYGHFKGARDAVDEFLRDRRVAMLLNRVDYSGRVGIKIADAG